MVNILRPKNSSSHFEPEIGEIETTAHGILSYYNIRQSAAKQVRVQTTLQKTRRDDMARSGIERLPSP